MRRNLGEPLRALAEVCHSFANRNTFGNAIRIPSVLAILCVAIVLGTSTVVAQQAPPSSAVGTSEAPQQVPLPVAPQWDTNSQDSSSTQDSSTQQSQSESGQFVFKKKVAEVVLHAVVVDQENNLISNVQQDAFTILEDGKLQKVTSFRRENAPLALGILIDNSGSMLPKRQKVNDAALNLVRASNTQDEVFVVNFGEEYYLDQDFTDDVVKLGAALNRIETRGSTALYDAIVASAKHIRHGAQIQKRVLLVVTDGRDNASQESLEESVQELQERDGPVVYVIGFVDQTKQARSTIRALQTISTNTGGAAYFPKSLSEVDEIATNIAHDIRSQYVIGYRSSNSSDARSFHTIDVQVRDGVHHGLRVRTRTGYYSEAPQE